MKFNAINKRYNELVTDYMNRGYYLNAGTMSGSQGEMSKIDLTDGKEIIRILVENYTDYSTDFGAACVRIVVGRNTDNATPNTDRYFDTIWNNHLEVLSEEIYYEIGRDRFGASWYGTKEEFVQKWQKQVERHRARKVNRDKEFSDDAKKIVLTFLKKQYKCKSAKIADITSVVKTYEKNWRTDEIKVQYKFKAKGKTYILK